MTVREHGIAAVRRALLAQVRRLGGYAPAACALGLAPTTGGYLCNVVHGRARPSPRVLAALGYERATATTHRYRRLAA